jgi:hypothetical protein
VIVSEDGLRSRSGAALIVEASLGCGVCNEVTDFRCTLSGIGGSLKEPDDLADFVVRSMTGICTGEGGGGCACCFKGVLMVMGTLRRSGVPDTADRAEAVDDGRGAAFDFSIGAPTFRGRGGAFEDPRVEDATDVVDAADVRRGLTSMGTVRP